VDAVLDVHAGHAGGERLLDQLRRCCVVAGFEVRADRDVDRGGDPGDAVQSLVERHALVVGLPSGIGERVAADAERREPRIDHGPGRPRVPDRRQHERGTGVVQGVELAGAGFECRHGPILHFSARLTSTIDVRRAEKREVAEKRGGRVRGR